MSGKKFHRATQLEMASTCINNNLIPCINNNLNPLLAELLGSSVQSAGVSIRLEAEEVKKLDAPNYTVC